MVAETREINIQNQPSHDLSDFEKNMSTYHSNADSLKSDNVALLTTDENNVKRYRLLSDNNANSALNYLEASRRALLESLPDVADEQVKSRLDVLSEAMYNSTAIAREEADSQDQQAGIPGYTPLRMAISAQHVIRTSEDDFQNTMSALDRHLGAGDGESASAIPVLR
jgi:hypothetical protein